MRFDLLWEEGLAFGKCLKIYFQKRAGLWVARFETGKDRLVEFLLAKRGLYSRPFLHTSLALLVLAGAAAAPIIASNYSGGQVEFMPPSAVLGALSTATDQTSTLISDKPRDQILIYKVQKGDTLGAIADKFGVSVDSIKWASDLKSDRLSLDQEIKIPPVTGIVHKVKAGDTIYSLAKHYKTDAQKIVNFPFNDFTDLDTFALSIGQTLVIPDGVIPEARPIIPSFTTSQMAGGGSGQFFWPTGGSISQYPVWYHLALDIANSSAPGIAAAADGTIQVLPFMAYGYGYYITIDHGSGLQTLYAHLSEIYVTSGQRVSRGQIIGKMGSTGRSTGTHLHFEVRKNGIIINPLPFLK